MQTESGDRAATQARQKRKLKEAGIALSEIIRNGQGESSKSSRM
jgi:hypothetical protein